jgi:hypothetical protein
LASDVSLATLLPSGPALMLPSFLSICLFQIMCYFPFPNRAYIPSSNRFVCVSLSAIWSEAFLLRLRQSSSNPSAAGPDFSRVKI